MCDALEAEAPTACNPVAYADGGSKGTPLAYFFLAPFLWIPKEMGRGTPQIGTGKQGKALCQSARLMPPRSEPEERPGRSGAVLLESLNARNFQTGIAERRVVSDNKI